MSDTDRELIRHAIQSVLWNASNYPGAVQPRILGQDITPLTEKVADAVMYVVTTKLTKAREDQRERDAKIAEGMGLMDQFSVAAAIRETPIGVKGK